MNAAELISHDQALNLLAEQLCVREARAQAVFDDGVRGEHLHPIRIGRRVRYWRRDVLALADRVAQAARADYYPDPDAAYKAELEDALIGDLS